MDNELEQLQDQIPPDETSGILVEGFIKIHDPDTGEVFVEERA